MDKQLRIIAVTKKYVEKVARFGSLFPQDNSPCGKRKGNASIQVKLPSNPQIVESLQAHSMGTDVAVYMKTDPDAPPTH